MGSPLISLARAKIAFPNLVDTTQDATIQVLIDSASRAIERYCKRIFTLTAYDEIYDILGVGSFLLKQFPVLSITRLALSPTNVVTIKNTLSQQTQASRCTVATTLANASDWPAASNGLTLTRVDATGTANTDASLAWTTYPTVQQLANAINAVGNGWTATVQGSYGIWASADINAVQGALSAFGAGAQLTIHVNDQNVFDLDPNIGEVRFGNTLSQLDFSAGWTGSGYNTELYPGIAVPRGSHECRVQYTAGFSFIPDDVQNACALLAAHMYAHPAQAGELISESIGDYSYTRQNLDRLPAKVLSYLYPYRDHRV